MKKVVLKLDVHDDRCKQKVMKKVSTLPGLDSISMDMKEKKLTLTGDIDPVAVVSKLRKVYQTEIVSVGPAKEPEKKKDEPKKEEPKKEEPKKKDEPKANKGQPKKEESKDQAQVAQLVKAYEAYNNHPLYPRHYYARSIEEDPNACAIC